MTGTCSGKGAAGGKATRGGSIHEVDKIFGFFVHILSTPVLLTYILSVYTVGRPLIQDILLCFLLEDFDTNWVVQ